MFSGIVEWSWLFVPAISTQLIADDRYGRPDFKMEGARFRKVSLSWLFELTAKTISSAVHGASNIL